MARVVLAGFPVRMRQGHAQDTVEIFDHHVERHSSQRFCVWYIVDKIFESRKKQHIALPRGHVARLAARERSEKTDRTPRVGLVVAHLDQLLDSWLLNRDYRKLKSWDLREHGWKLCEERENESLDESMTCRFFVRLVDWLIGLVDWLRPASTQEIDRRSVKIACTDRKKSITPKKVEKSRKNR